MRTKDLTRGIVEEHGSKCSHRLWQYRLVGGSVWMTTLGYVSFVHGGAIVDGDGVHVRGHDGYINAEWRRLDNDGNPLESW
jgi:hypothetical protein